MLVKRRDQLVVRRGDQLVANRSSVRLNVVTSHCGQRRSPVNMFSPCLQFVVMRGDQLVNRKGVQLDVGSQGRKPMNG